MTNHYQKEITFIFLISATMVDKLLNFIQGIKTFSRRFHNGGNGFIGNEDHPRILKGKNVIRCGKYLCNIL